MPRTDPIRPSTASEQLAALLGEPWPFTGRPPKHDPSSWRVIDDWPEAVPVTDAEIMVFIAGFGDLFDDLLVGDAPAAPSREFRE